MHLVAAALVIMFGNVASRLLGIVREQVIAALFGASAATDAFTIADRIPRSVYDLIIGAMISALVPVFSDYVDDPDVDRLWHAISTVLSLLATVLTVVVVVLIVLAPQLVAIFGYGFTGDVRDLTVQLVRIALPVVICLGLAGVLTSILYARRRFLAPALANVAYNGGIIVVALLFHERLGILSLVIGILVGGLAQLVIQMIGFGRPKFRLILDFRHPIVGRIIRLYGPVGMGVGITSIGVAIDANLASRTGEGSLAAMRFATTLVQFPLGLVATALSFAILPTLSRQATLALTSEAGTARFKRTLTAGVRVATLAILPAAAVLLILRQPIIALLFQHGRFNAEDTARTAVAFVAYSPGLVGAAIDQLLIAAFYARKDTLTPNLVAAAGVGVYLIVGLSLIGPIGMPGLALANSAQIVSHAVILWLLLDRRIGGLPGSGFGPTVLKALIATGLMTAAVGLAGRLTGEAGPDRSTAAAALALSLELALGGAVYVAALFALRVDEVSQAVGLARARWAGLRGRAG